LYRDTPAIVNGGHPTLTIFPPSLGEHPFGQDRVGRDSFAMTMRGAQISLSITVIVGLTAALVGVVIGAVSGYFRGRIESILMRFTDMIIIIPPLISAAVIARQAGSLGYVFLGLFLGLVYWTGMARLVRADFLSLREREFVDAARLAGASDGRIIFKHILPNAIGVITVNMTLLMSTAILLETALSYLGFGVRPPDTSLGLLINQNQGAFGTRPWLFWWPGAFIVVICLCINFIGDGLRDAFDPRQKKFSDRQMRRASRAERRVAERAERAAGARS
jgi:ABC-type dipeptide/oligopeptide/nickel transport system permease subunit